MGFSGSLEVNQEPAGQEEGEVSSPDQLPAQLCASPAPSMLGDACQCWFLHPGRCSVAQPCAILCDPMKYSTPDFPVLHHLPELAQTHVHGATDVIQPSHPLSPPSSPRTTLLLHQLTQTSGTTLAPEPSFCRHQPSVPDHLTSVPLAQPTSA